MREDLRIKLERFFQGGLKADTLRITVVRKSFRNSSNFLFSFSRPFVPQQMHYLKWLWRVCTCLYLSVGQLDRFLQTYEGVKREKDENESADTAAKFKKDRPVFLIL